MRTVRLGTRGSALAVTQSRWVARALEAAASAADLDLNVELVQVRTQGDVDPTALAALGGVGVFATALREALLAGECDLAVHSYKDLPTTPTPGLRVACVPPREDPRDVLCLRPDLTARPTEAPTASRAGGTRPTTAASSVSEASTDRPRGATLPAAQPADLGTGGGAGHDAGDRSPSGTVSPGTDLADALNALPRGARVGTGSPRRWAQLLALRPDLEIVPIRGNVPTRLSRVVGDVVGADGPMGLAPGREPDLDAVVLAYAGMRRLGLDGYASIVLDPALMLPAAAQGALAVEVREDASERPPELTAALALVDDPLTRACADAERALMRALGAGCAAPVGALARPVDTNASDAAASAVSAGPVPADALPSAAHSRAVGGGQEAGRDVEATEAPFAAPAGAGAHDIRLDAAVVSLDGRESRHVSLTGSADDAARLGADAAARLLEAGAGQITDLHATKDGTTRA